MYVAVKGGEKAIANAHGLLAEKRRGDQSVPELSLAQIEGQLGLAVDRVMAEGSVYDRELAALAIKQAQGDTIEAVFLLRAYRTTLPRLGVSEPVSTSQMRVHRRISAVFKDLPGGQILGPTYDYTHRLLDFTLSRTDNRPPPVTSAETCKVETASSCAESCRVSMASSCPPAEDTASSRPSHITGIIELLEGLVATEEPEKADHPVGDITREPLRLPAGRDVRLQNLARGDEGFLHAMAYSAIRGFGFSAHPFAGELRVGEVSVEIVPEELGFAVEIGEILVTECTMLYRDKGSKTSAPGFEHGYGMSFGHCERRAMSMSILDITLGIGEKEEAPVAPSQNAEFILYHSDSVEASGFLQHLKLPHCVDFQAELVWVRRARQEYFADAEKAKGSGL